MRFGKKNQDKEEPDDHALGRSQGGFGTKMHLLVSRGGVPLSVVLSPGQSHECKFVEEVLEAVDLPHAGRGRPRRKPEKLAGDKGYSFEFIRDYLRNRKITPVIPFKSNQDSAGKQFDKKSYRDRNWVERLVGWIKENRRIGTRFEKMALNFIAMIKMAFIRRCFRLLELSDTA